MKKLIVDSFKSILNVDVRVVNIPDDVDMAIFILDKRMAKKSDKELSTYEYDFAITRLNNVNDTWLYLIRYDIPEVVRGGEYISPPNSDYVESVMTYKTSENALHKLILEIVKDKFNDLLMCREEHENY